MRSTLEAPRPRHISFVRLTLRRFPVPERKANNHRFLHGKRFERIRGVRKCGQDAEGRLPVLRRVRVRGQLSSNIDRSKTVAAFDFSIALKASRQRGFLTPSPPDSLRSCRSCRVHFLSSCHGLIMSVYGGPRPGGFFMQKNVWLAFYLISIHFPMKNNYILRIK